MDDRHGNAGTNEPFSTMSLQEIRDPMLTGPGSPSWRASADAFDQAAQRLSAISDQMAAVEREYAEAHQGEAAEAAKVFLRRLGEPGRVGAITFGQAGRSLREQADFYDLAKQGLEGLTVPVPPPNVLPAPYIYLTRHQEAARDIANRYQDSSNGNVPTFEPFPPPVLPTPDLSAGPQVATPAWPGVAGGGSAAGLAPATAPDPGLASPTAPPGAGGGVGSGSAGVGALPGPTAPIGTAGSLADRGTTSIGTAGSVGDRGTTPSGRVGLPDAPGVGAAPAGTVGGVPGRSTGFRAPVAGDRRTTGGAGPEAVRGGAGGPRAGSTGRVGAGERVLGERVSREEAVREGAAARGQAGARQSHLPMVPGGAGAARQGDTRKRPDWLVEDDPEGYWLADVPDYGPSLLGGAERDV